MPQRYEILDLLATGGMAEIYRGRAFGAGGFEKPIVVKKILPTLVRDREFVEMFIEEAKLAATLQHGNIVQVYDLGAGDDEDEYFIIMEYVNGRDLGDVIHYADVRKVEIGFKEAVYIVTQVCAALDYAHRKRGPDGKPLGIIHRDVSPQNVLLSFEGEVKLTDFGIAKAKTRVQRTQVGFLKGKYGYMSPEQSRGERLDHRSDIFNVGIMLYELLVGERLFVGSSDFSTLNLMRNAVVTPPRKLKGEIPEGLEAIVMKALALKPEDRFQTAQEMERALTRFSFEQSLVASAADIARLMERIFGKPKPDLPQPKGTRVIALGSVDGRGKDKKADAKKRGERAAGTGAGSGTSAASDSPASEASSAAAPPALGEKAAGKKPRTVPLGPSKRATGAAKKGGRKADGEAKAANAKAKGTGKAPHKQGAKKRGGKSGSPRPTTLDLRKKKGEQRAKTGKVAVPKSPRAGGLVRSLGVVLVYAVAFTAPAAALVVTMGKPEPTRASTLRAVESKRLAALAAHAGAAGDLAAPEALLLVRSEPPGARVQVDGVPAEGRTPTLVPIAREKGGSHRVTLTRDGYEPWEGKAVLPAKARATVLKARLVPKRYRLRVRSRPRGAQVLLDGEEVGTTPVAVPRVAAGRHEIELRRPGFLPWKAVYEVGSGRTTVDARLAKEGEAAQLSIVTWPAARVAVDGGWTVDSGEPLFVAPGEHVLRFERPGAAPVERRVRLARGDRTKLFFDLRVPSK